MKQASLRLDDLRQEESECVPSLRLAKCGLIFFFLICLNKYNEKFIVWKPTLRGGRLVRAESLLPCVPMQGVLPSKVGKCAAQSLQDQEGAPHYRLKAVTWDGSAAWNPSAPHRQAEAQVSSLPSRSLGHC